MQSFFHSDSNCISTKSSWRLSHSTTVNYGTNRWWEAEGTHGERLYLVPAARCREEATWWWRLWSVRWISPGAPPAPDPSTKRRRTPCLIVTLNGLCIGSRVTQRMIEFLTVLCEQKYVKVKEPTAFTKLGFITLGPTYNEFGYNEQIFLYHLQQC